MPLSSKYRSPVLGWKARPEAERNPVAIVGDGEPDHTIRGGSWASSPDEVRATRRWRVFLIEADLPESQVGFRCAKD